MIKSMTGYGKSDFTHQKKRVVVEIKSLNAKQLDISTRLPNGYREKDLEIRSMVGNALERGKIDIMITAEENGSAANFSINRTLASKYYQEVNQLASDFGLKDTSDMLALILRMPEVLVPAREELSNEEWELLKEAIKKTIEKVEVFRGEEGAVLQDDLFKRNQRLLEMLEKIRPHEKKRIEILKAKIRKDLLEMASVEDVDQNRFEQELVYYLEKMDITEEKVRLRKHCRFFETTLLDNGSHGKKLIFITQEMGREINTLGSKSNDANIQKLVVNMKDELEKMKEQLFNIL